MSLYEIEIKSLLGAQDKASELKGKLEERGGKLSSQNKQLNHYFTVSDIRKFRESFEKFIPEDKNESFIKITEEGKDCSIRTRQLDSEVILVIKASIGDDTSSNGIAKMEFEVVMDMSLDELDQALIDAGLKYQAKWSREREEYKLGDINVCIDKNAGYGYLAEFEKVVPNESRVEVIKQELRDMMFEFGVEELSQDRLERMFAHYNANWQDYYGTDKVFNIE